MNKTKLSLLFLTFSLAFFSLFSHYSHYYSYRPNIENTDEIIWEEKAKTPFTEVLFSWNAFRPLKGFFSFWVRVYRNKEWSEWAKIAEWGNGFQKTCANTKDDYVKVRHVRAVVEKIKGEKFLIKVVANDGADIKNIKKLFANTADEYAFEFGTMPSKKCTSLCIQNMPRQSQKTLDHVDKLDLCSPTSAIIVSEYFFLKKSKKTLSEKTSRFADRVFDKSYLQIYGSWPLNTAELFHFSQGKLLASVLRLNSFDELYEKYLKKNIPVAVSIRASLGDLTGAQTKMINGEKRLYDNGHFVVIIGWNAEKQKVICLDPAFSHEDNMQREYDVKEFIHAWDKSRHLIYDVKRCEFS